VGNKASVVVVTASNASVWRRIICYVKLLRPKDHFKNGYVFAPAFFAGTLLDLDLLGASFAAFAVFSLAAGSVYIVNDMRDAEHDRNHPTKATRPIAAGEVKILPACLLAIVAASISLYVSLLLTFDLFVVIAAYLAMNVAYTFKLKEMAIVDVTVISVGFVLRVLAGGVTTGIIVSKWLVIIVFLLSMFQAVAKRLDDIRLLNAGNPFIRPSLRGYNEEFLKVLIPITVGLLMVTYLIYITSPAIIQHLGEGSYITFIFVFLGLIRYLQLTIVFNRGGSPVQVLVTDIFIQVNLVLWVATFSYMIYFR
jgi:decaprenyl-phosphate phosphoribosyltransferase